MKAIKITTGSKIVRRNSNRFSNRDYSLLNALAYVKGFKVSTTTKSIIMNGEKYLLRKVNGYIYAGTNNLSAMINDRIVHTSKFLTQLQAL